MVEVPYRTFVHQQNGIIFISNGENEILFSSMDEFLIEEPNYSFTNVISLAYERNIFHIHEDINGKIEITTREFPNQELENYINKVPAYIENQEWRNHPLSKAKNLYEAKEIAKLEINIKAHGILKLTDWYFMRQLSSGKYIPCEIQMHRKLILEESNSRNDKVNSMTTINEIREFLKDLNDGWHSLPEKYYRY